MKKILSVILIVFLFFFIIQPTYAVETTQTNPIIELLNIFLHFGQGGSSTQNPSTTPGSLLTITPDPNITPQIFPGNKVYYAQCNGALGSGYGNLPLPNGCTYCRAACGPTAVAMIASSYVDIKYNPKVIVDIYKSRGYYIGCNGSTYNNAKKLLQDLGLKTTTDLVLNRGKAETVVPRLKSYLDAGWTFIAVGSFPTGHFFWITDIDNQGNIWAYDSYYGRWKVPYNENSKYPYPLYTVALGVKK